MHPLPIAASAELGVAGLPEPIPPVLGVGLWGRNPVYHAAAQTHVHDCG